MEVDIGVVGGKVSALGDLFGAVVFERFDVGGLYVLFGVIDI